MQALLLNAADSARSAGGYLAKAHLLCQELADNYFQYAPLPREGLLRQQGFIVWEYRRAALFAHMLQDYLHQAEAELQTLNHKLTKEEKP